MVWVSNNLDKYFAKTRVSKVEQTYRRTESTSLPMANEISILTCERDGDDGLIATFSDGTTGAYVIEELLGLRPFRERAKTKETQVPLVDTRAADGLPVV